MSREAKIGMLTGMFVIVLIGVLLSEYLGNAGTPAQSSRTPAMPSLGESYRRNTLQPVTVPGLARTAEPTLGELSIPPAYATDRTPTLAATTPTTPTLSEPGTPSIPPLVSDVTTPVTPTAVTAVPAGNVVEPIKPTIPTIETIDVKATHPVTVVDTSTFASTPAPKGQEYTVAKGDTLDKLAKKFLGSATKQNKALIIAANPKTLHDEASILVVGKKLIIPVSSTSTPTLVSDTPKADYTKAPEFPVSGPMTKKDTVIAPPGHTLEKTAEKKSDKPLAKTSEKSTTETAKKAEPKKDVSVSLYVVKKGDTLEKIAKSVSPKQYREVIKSIMSANNLKDADSIKEGMKLSIPALKA